MADPAPIRGRWTIQSAQAGIGTHGAFRRIEAMVEGPHLEDPTPVVPVPDEAAIERAKEAGHAAYHAHNEECACRTVGHLAEYVALAVLRAALEPTDP